MFKATVAPDMASHITKGPSQKADQKAVERLLVYIYNTAFATSMIDDDDDDTT